MGKKKSLNLLFLIGMIVAAVGCFLPLATVGGRVFGKIDGNSVWGLLTAKDCSTWLRIATLSILSGAALGIVFTFVKIKVSGTLRLVGVIALGAGCAIELIYKLTASNFAKSVGKGLAKAFNAAPSFGYFLIAAGLVLAIIGLIKEK